MKDTYDILVDYGKPYERIGITELELFNELQQLKEMSESEGIAYCDITIYNNETKQNITDEMFKEFENENRQ